MLLGNTPHRTSQKNKDENMRTAVVFDGFYLHGVREGPNTPWN